MNEQRWFAFYTKARWEKKVNKYLESFGFEPFLPLVKELHQWSDRKKMVIAPLFRSYIFVLTSADKIPEVLKIPGVSWSVKHERSPAYLRNEEKRKLELLLKSGYQLEDVTEEGLKVGEKVTVTSGPLQNLEGIVLAKEKDKIRLSIPSLDKTIRVSLPEGLLKKT